PQAALLSSLLVARVTTGRIWQHFPGDGSRHHRRIQTSLTSIGGESNVVVQYLLACHTVGTPRCLEALGRADDDGGDSRPRDGGLLTAVERSRPCIEPAQHQAGQLRE